MAITQSPLKMGLSKAKDVYVQVAKDFGNRIGNIASKVSDTAKNIREIRNPDLIQRQQGAAGSNTGGGVGNNNNSGNTGVQLPDGVEAKPSDFKPIDFSKPSISITAPSESQRLFNTASQENRLGVSKGPAGTVQYTQDSSGSILRQNNEGNISKLGAISSIGPNGSTVSRDLRPDEIAAMDRSKQMISDYYKSKEVNNLKSFLNNNLGNPYVTAAQRRTAENRLGEIEKGDLTREQIGSAERIQNIQSDIAARKNQYEAAKEERKFGLDIAKARSDSQVNSLKLINDMREKGASDGDIFATLKDTRQLTPSLIRSMFGNQDYKSVDDIRTGLTRLGYLSDQDRYDIESILIDGNQQ